MSLSPTSASVAPSARPVGLTLWLLHIWNRQIDDCELYFDYTAALRTLAQTVRDDWANHRSRCHDHRLPRLVGVRQHGRCRLRLRPGPRRCDRRQRRHLRFGVDEAAHRGALTGDGRTVVVLPCGVDQNHPHQHARLYETVIEHGGLLVSEYPIGVAPARIRFHARCRLLAALTSATVIVEAGIRSGALATARAANDLGRRVYGVPGSIHSARSKGVNELLRIGAATAVSSAEHINNYQEGI